ncbi:MAG: alpha/beta hydrolase [Spirochaetes bacterium]|nr:alpha/beta hydrolase [Spirochaetota bacterium]
MKKKIVLIILAILLLVIFLGPRVKVDTTIPPIAIPDDVESYVKESEAKFADITPGAEKTIVWFNSTKKNKTPFAVIYLHGFSATRQEIAPVCDIVAKNLKANLFYTRLRGHGRPADALKGVTVNDWLTDTVEAIEIGKRIGEKLIIISTSMGGTLTTWYALTQRTDNIAAAVMISPNFYPARKEARIMTWPWGKQIAHLLIGEYRTWKPQNELQAKYWSWKQPTEATVTMMGLVEMVKSLDFHKFQLPLLMILSPNDKVINYSLAKQRFEEATSGKKKLVEITDSTAETQHVIAGDILSPNTTKRVAEEIISFIRNL